MIEALIAFAVLSFGIMGVVTLITGSKANQFEIVQRTRAVTLANSLVERIRINPLGIATYNTGLDTPVALGATQPSPDCSTATCDATQLATHDLWEWGEELRGATALITATDAPVGGLQSPLACVVFANHPDHVRTGTLTVVVSWRGLAEVRDAAAGGDVCGTFTAGEEKFRRQVSVQTYIIDETEL
jgi:type IV pilus assembly protein PilV